MKNLVVAVFPRISGKEAENRNNSTVFSHFHVPMTSGTVVGQMRDISAEPKVNNMFRNVEKMPLRFRRGTSKISYVRG